MNKNLNFRLVGYINSFLASSFLILLFKRELNDFDYSLWGILTSATLIFSIITQFTMPNMIEKDFFNLNTYKKFELIQIYVKYLIILSPFIYFLIFCLYNTNKYFYSYKFLIPFMVFLLITIENSINLINKILITKKESPIFDKVELFIVKYLRLSVFLIYFFLIKEISFLQILILHLTTRLFSLVILLYLKKDYFTKFKLKNFKNLDSELFKSYFFSNLYNFLINFSQFFFYNFIYLSSSYFFTEKYYSNLSLYFIIFIFCRNFFDAFANLKTPEIKRDKQFSKLSIFEKEYFLYSVQIVLLFYLILELIFQLNLYNFLGNFITADSSTYIASAIFHGFITGIYSFRHYIFKFNETISRTHLNFYLINFIISTSLFFILINITLSLYSLVSTLIFYELLNIVFYYLKFKQLSNRNQFYSFSYTFLLLFLAIYLDNLYVYLLISIFSILILIKNKTIPM